MPLDGADDARPFRFPVQFVNRPNLDFRGFAGTIASGTVAPGDEVVVAKSGKSSRVKRIVTWDGDLENAHEGQAVTIVLEDEIEVSRGNMLVAPETRPEVADQFAAHLVWFAEHALIPGGPTFYARKPIKSRRRSPISNIESISTASLKLRPNRLT